MGMSPGLVRNAAAVALRGGGLWRHALALLAEQRAAGRGPDAVGYSAAAGVCVAGGQWERALCLLPEMRAVGMDATALGELLAACAAGGQWELAVALVREPQASVVAYSTAVACCGDSRRWEEAVSLVGAMRQRSVRPNIVTHAALVGACGEALQWRAALQLASAARPWDAVVCGALASAFCKVREWELAAELLSEMWRERLRPNEITVGNAVYACAVEHRWALALSLSAEARAVAEPSSWACGHVTVCAVWNGQHWQQALALLASVSRDGGAPARLALALPAGAGAELAEAPDSLSWAGGPGVDGVDEEGLGADDPLAWAWSTRWRAPAWLWAVVAPQACRPAARVAPQRASTSCSSRARRACAGRRPCALWPGRGGWACDRLPPRTAPSSAPARGRRALDAQRRASFKSGLSLYRGDIQK
ncbi:unnamed protein product [Prorocentrum cordatum]|uniref:Pentatricopeptide repeat-containing protein, chloroplastic n=1 Tax=Prorocentrum cordatum TaxID=2364126 RepID=A0ABN9WEQ0_9DINO|nr:unnamed protein product [Polarella glacialis]